MFTPRLPDSISQTVAAGNLDSAGSQGPDRLAFDAALRSFLIGAYPRAAEEFSAFEAGFVSSAHGEAEIAHTLEAARVAVREVAATA